MSRWRVVTELPEQVWEEFVASHPRSSIFHTPLMHAVFARAEGHTPLLLAAVTDHGRPVALLTAVRITLKGGLAARWTTRVVAYGGFLAEESDRGQDALRALLEEHNRRAGIALFTELRHMSDPGPWRAALNATGYRWEPHLNFLISLTAGEKGVWQRLKPNARQHIRRAEKQGLVAREVKTPDDLAIWYDIMQEGYLRARVPLAPFGLFAAAHRLLVPSGQARFWLAWHENTPVAARAVLLHRDTVLDWYAAYRASHQRLRPNDFMVWYVLRWAIRAGYHTFDFGGAGHPDKPYGVRHFKAKFGGTQVNYGRSTRVHHPWRLWVSRAAYTLWRRLRRK